jgi:hypothetical protein
MFYDRSGRPVVDRKYDESAIDVRLPIRGRYTPVRKITIVSAVKRGVMTAEEAQSIHGVSPEEWASWVRDADPQDWRKIRVSRR